MREKRLQVKLTIDGIFQPFDCELVQPQLSSSVNYEEVMNLRVNIDFSTFDEHKLKFYSRAQVIVFDRDDPDGRVRFDGFLMNYSIDHESNSVMVELRSESNNFNNRVFEEVATEDYNSGAKFSGTAIYDLGSEENAAAVGRITTDTATTISFITLNFWVELSGPYPFDTTVTLTLHETLADAQDLDSEGLKSSTIQVFDTWPKEFSFPMDDVAVSASTNYYIRVVTNVGTNNWVAVASSSHAGDHYYTYDDDTDTWNTRTGWIIYARVYTQTGNTVFEYNSTDIADILRDIIDSQQLFGGQVEYTGITIPDTGVVTDMQFSTQLQSEAIQQCMSALGEDYVFTVDSASNLAWLIYLPDAETEHNVTVGRGISGLVVTKSGEGIYSDLFFSGGDTGAGTNLFKRYNNNATRRLYRNRSQSYQDGRVKVEDTADKIANKLLSRGAEPNVLVEFTVLDNTHDEGGYDIEDFNIGDVVKVLGVNEPGSSSLWDVALFDEDYFDYDIASLATLTLAIREVEYELGSARIIAASLNIAQFSSLRGMRKDIVQQLVEENPDAPTT